ncbi:MFS transporter [Nocardia bovistercoris]|uniref:MFS transporter n=1 Tax=Nocardia bovistercoris TaxID=2785916 RepID=A0A931N3Q4_9NOCA|nr:MFS transporter [Nocardia bovistercoris]MBH0778069.1 MFS transporter [Nocardia bovistercoris]
MSRTKQSLAPAQFWALALSCVAVALVIAGMVALYTALPNIASDTGATQTQLTWITDGYTLALACLVLPGGALGDRYGRRRVMVGGLFVFAAASSLPLFIEGPAWLIAARALTGVGAALVMPSTLSLLTAGFPEQRRGFAIGVWAAAVASGAVVGLLGTGLLLANWSWLSIPAAMAIAGVVLAIAGCTVPESVDESRPAFDLWGALLSATAIGLIVVAAAEVPRVGWGDPIVIAAIVGGIGASATFVAVELRVDQPLLDMRLFTDRGFAGGAFAVTLQFLVVFGVFMLIVQYLQLILGYEPFAAAIALSPIMIPMLPISPIAPWLAERLGLRAIICAGMGVTVVGMFGLARLTVDSAYIDLLWPLMVLGLGLALSATPATAAIVAGVPEHKHGVAAAVNDATREVGAALGIAVAGSVLAAGYTERIAAVTAKLPEQLRGPVSDSLAAALGVAESIGPAAQPVADQAKEAFVHGARQAATTLGFVTLIAMVAAAVWTPGRRRPEPEAVAAPAEPERVGGSE